MAGHGWYHDRIVGLRKNQRKKHATREGGKSYNKKKGWGRQAPTGRGKKVTMMPTSKKGWGGSAGKNHTGEMKNVSS